MVAEKVTVKVFDYILTPYISFIRSIIGGHEQMGNILLGLGLMFVGRLRLLHSGGNCNAVTCCVV